MVLHCYAIVPDQEERGMLAAKLRHHNTPVVEAGERVSIDMECTATNTVLKLLEYFESVNSTERGFSIIGGREEVKYDSG